MNSEARRLDGSMDFFFFAFPNRQIRDMRRKRNWAEIRCMGQDDMLFPLFPQQNSIPKSVTLQGGGGGTYERSFKNNFVVAVSQTKTKRIQTKTHRAQHDNVRFTIVEVFCDSR